MNVLATPPEQSNKQGTRDFNARASVDRSALLVTVNEGEARRLAHAAHTDPEAARFEYRRAPLCNVNGPVPTTPLNGPCPPAVGDTGPNACGEDTVVDPLWMRERSTPTSQDWGPWTQVDQGGCAADLLPVLTAEDFRRLPLAAPTLTMQPDRGWVLVNIETIVMTDPTAQTLRTELLGHGIDVVATPTTYRYDFGDDLEPLITDSPGHPWPDHDTFHIYQRPGTRQITLTTTWHGTYRVDGSPIWRDVDGTAQTSTTSPPFDVQERRSHLVSTLCTDIPKPDDCR
ncbi:hypothetical protein [Cellulomonas sp. URHB0016]